MAVDNIKIAEQLKQLQEDMNSLVEAQTKSLKNQLDIVRQISDSLSQMTTSSNETVGNLQKQQKSLEDAATAADKLGNKNTMKNFANSVRKGVTGGEGLVVSLKKAVKLLPQFAAFGGIWDGFTAGISGTVNALKLFGSTTMTALEAIGQLALSVISFPFKILGNLINFASQGGGDNSLRQALEDIRKEFGDLRKSSSRAIIDIARGMKGELANTGLSVWRTFGRLADRLKTIAEYAKNLGNIFANLRLQFVKNAEAVSAYFKGLHLTEEGQKGVATRAYALGQDLTEVTRQIANFSVQLADEFGQSAAQVSQDVGDMMADFEHFGGMAPQILTQISVYARRLGVDVKGLLGVIDQFDNFEDAARSASMLTQSFGLQLDALQLLKAQDPAERTEMIRKAFFQAGRSVENMTRQERALLAQQTGLEASTLDLVFSQKNQSLSYEQVKKKSDAAQKSQLTQAEALQKIAGAIERLVKSGATGAGGFFERFFQGFERGIIRSHEFRKLMIDIRMALRQTYLAGVSVGQAFVRLFPGIRQLLQGLDGLFDRNRFREMTKSLRTIFRDFFTSLTSTSGRDSFKNLMDRLKTMFWNYFNGSTPAGRNILEGIRKFSKAASVIIAGLVREAAKGITTGIHLLSDLLSGRKSLSGGGAASDALSFITELFQPILDAIKEAWPPMVAALEQLWTEEIWPRVKGFLIDHAGAISLLLFGPAFGRALIGGLVSAVGGSLTKGLIEAFTKAFTGSAVRQAAQSGLSSVIGAVANPQAIQAATSATIATGEAGAAAQAASATANASVIPRMIQIGAVIAIGVAAITLAIWGLAELMRARHLTPQSMFAAAGILGAAGLVMIEIAAAVLVVSQAGTLMQGSLPGALIGLVAVGVFAAAMTEGIVYAVEQLSGFDTTQLKSAVTAMVAGGAFVATASLVLIAATAVGAFFLATSGAGVAAAIAGFAAIGLTTEAMIVEIQRVISAVGHLTIPGDIDRRLSIFSTVLGAITSFGGLIVSISQASSTTSVMSWFTGGAAGQQVDSLKAIREVMTDMGREITSLVTTLTGIVTGLSGSEEQVKKAEIFGTIMTALGGLLTSLQAPSAIISGGGGVLSTLIGADIAGNLSNYSVFIENMGVSLGNVVRDVLGAFSQILSAGGGSTFTTESLKGFEIIANILTVVGTMGRNLISIVNSQFSNLSNDDLRARAQVVGEVVGTMMESIFTGGATGGLISAISVLITQMVGVLSGLNASDARRLSQFGPLLIASFSAVGSIATAVSSISAITENIPASEQGSALGTVNAIVQNLFNGVSTIATTLISSLKGALAGLTSAQVSAMTKGVAALKSMFEAVVALPPALQSLYEGLSAGTTGGEHQYQEIHDRLGTITSLFNPDALPAFFRQVINTFNNLPEITGNPGTKLEELSKGISSLSVIRDLDFNSLATGIEANAEVLKSEAFQHLSTNVAAMVEQVNSIATDLGAIQPVNINTSLKALAGRLGLGDSEEITIRNRDFNIDVNVTVNVDAQELERVLIERPNSRIMSRPGGGGR